MAATDYFSLWEEMQLQVEVSESLAQPAPARPHWQLLHILQEQSAAAGLPEGGRLARTAFTRPARPKAAGSPGLPLDGRLARSRLLALSRGSACKKYQK